MGVSQKRGNFWDHSERDCGIYLSIFGRRCLRKLPCPALCASVRNPACTSPKAYSKPPRQPIIQMGYRDDKVDYVGTMLRVHSPIPDAACARKEVPNFCNESLPTSKLRTNKGLGLRVFSPSKMMTEPLFWRYSGSPCFHT